MLDDTESPADGEHTADTSSWDERELCPDGNCVGVLGPDGRCQLCGLGLDGSLMASGEAAVDDAALESDPEEGDVLTDRRLCPDGNCLGLLDEDNRCKVCGRTGD